MYKQAAEAISLLLVTRLLAQSMQTVLLQTQSGSMPYEIRHTVVNKELDALGRAYRRTALDPSLQSARGILGEIIAYHSYTRVVSVLEEGEIVGVAVYDIFEDEESGVIETHIFQIASFKPGVGTILVHEVEGIAKEEGSDMVTLVSEPDAVGFYRKLGFTPDPRYPEELNLMMKQLGS